MSRNQSSSSGLTVGNGSFVESRGDKAHIPRTIRGVLPYAVVVLASAFTSLNAQSKAPKPEYQIRTVVTMASTNQAPTAPIRSVIRVYFGRSDGSWGQQTTEVYNGRPCTSATFQDVATGQEITRSDCVKMKTTMPLRPGAIHGEAETTCSDKLADAHLSGYEQLQGLSVEKIESDDAEARATVYAAPLLGCLHVRSAYYWKGPDGKVISSTVEEPVEIRLSAPDPKLFEVPPEYREATPPERKNAMARYFDGKPDH